MDYGFVLLGFFCAAYAALWGVEKIATIAKEIFQNPLLERVEEVEAAEVGPLQEVTPSPVILRALGDEANLVVRHNAASRKATAMLFLWHGKGFAKDSYHLADVPALSVSDKLINEFIALAMDKLKELQNNPERLRCVGGI